jgi:hypothetical protein
LRQIAFELERASAPTYRVQAFRRAAAVLAAMSAAELARRVADGTLQDLRGIGPATASVIAQAAAGERPDDLLRQAADAGCLFAIDTDAHAPGQLDWLGDGCERAERAGITPDRVLNIRAAADITRG